MTTTSSVSVPGSKTLTEVFIKHKYRKVTNGLWMSADGIFKIFAAGDDPTTGWRVFRKNGTNFTAQDGGLGNGPDDLDKYLTQLV